MNTQQSIALKVSLLCCILDIIDDNCREKVLSDLKKEAPTVYALLFIYLNKSEKEKLLFLDDINNFIKECE